ncbi:MAG: cobaltochelatase subunit CobN [Candidatus Obscuribacterales bacterium]|nr:cobaltochelatase subunit CobN [Candidatus Obscuribacterales bacterium]
MSSGLSDVQATSSHKLDSRMVILSHADTDCLVLERAALSMPADFSPIDIINLQQISSDEDMKMLIDGVLAQSAIVVVRLLGKTSSVPLFSDFVRSVHQCGSSLIVVSGTGELNPELSAVSNVPVDLQLEVTAYLQAGGIDNFAQMLKCLSDKLLLTGFSYAPPAVIPDHGIYHPLLGSDATFLQWLEIHDTRRPVAGINFYRAHCLSGNTHFVDVLIDALSAVGIDALPVWTASLKACSDGDVLPDAYRYFVQEGQPVIDVLINTTSFAMAEVKGGETTASGWSVDALQKLNVPVIQAITSGMQVEQWKNSARGLNPLDTAMNVVLPEFDGRIISVPLSFKQASNQDHIEANTYSPVLNRAQRVAGLVQRLVRLRRLPNAEKRIAFVFTNSNAKASQIGNAVGLDAPASLMAVMSAMVARGYKFENLPDDGTKLIHDLISKCSYDETLLTDEQLRDALVRIPEKTYSDWFDELPVVLRESMVKQWGLAPGETYVHDQHLAFAGLNFGNALVILQPPRGYGMDPNAIYHMPDLPPTHHYYGLYKWLQDGWKADAIVHVGKHGTLEWLPGKGVGLSQDCFPDALLGNIPLFYPFIINDPGEGAQAKRRSHAVVVDHLTPPMTSADTYGALAKLTQLVDEYYQVEVLDPAKLPVLQQQIWELIKEANLHNDLKHILAHSHDEHDHDHDHEHDDHDHDDEHDHDHEWDDTLTQTGVPVTLAKMGGFDVAHLIQEIDGYLCELGAAEIRDGLHILGRVPEGASLVDTLCSLTRLANLHIPSLDESLAQLFGLDFKTMLEHKGARIAGEVRSFSTVAGRILVTNSDALEAIDRLEHQLFSELEKVAFDIEGIQTACAVVLGSETKADSLALQKIVQTLSYVCTTLVPNLQLSHEEIANLLHGLEGGYVPAGPSGAPSRGMAHILPTGRNFYSVDPRSLPSHSAWLVGKQLSEEVLRRHLHETGRYPESVSISMWGTSAMRTHGDDVAQILALMGVRPLWQDGTRQLQGVQLIPISELQRPRIDVTTRISGFFRDAFPHLIDLIDRAVGLAVEADEPLEENFLRKHYLQEVASRCANGVDESEAKKSSRYRVFGSKPGSYGAGILPLIQERNWSDADDFAEAYVNWGGFAYTQNEAGVDARTQFKERLKTIEVAVHNQDNREHDIFDSDDYLQFHGGMIATIRSLSGKKPKHYFGDTQDPSRAAVRDLKEEVLRVFRSRVVNPKWLESIQKHGYKGGLELTATVDYLFGYDATAEVLDDWMYEDVAKEYAFNPQMQEFLKDSNPWALNAIAERLLEAAKRKMWSKPKEETLAALTEVFLNSEELLELRGESKRASGVL